MDRARTLPLMLLRGGEAGTRRSWAPGEASCRKGGQCRGEQCVKALWDRTPIQEQVHGHSPTAQQGPDKDGDMGVSREGSAGNRRSRKPERNGRLWKVRPKKCRRRTR